MFIKEGKLRFCATNVFFRNLESNTRIVVNQGGTRSSKTYSLCQLFIFKLLQEENMVLTIARKTTPALKATVMRDFFEILESMEIYDPAMHKRTDMTYKLNGNLVEFVSLDQPQKKRGAKRDYLWLNEANEFMLEDYRQLALRTRCRIFLDFNPSDEFHWIYDEVLTRDDCTFIRSTYKDNSFLANEIVEEIERLRDKDNNYWKVFGLGERGTSQAAVYSHYQFIESLPEGGDIIYGLDFGYNNPTALVKVVIKDNVIYSEEVLYRTGLTNSQLIELLTQVSGASRYPIYADAAEPQRITEINRAGFDIKSADKDVRKGIDSIKSREWHITKKSTNLIKEARSYKYREDMSGNILEEPVKFNDHALDALRYAVHTHTMRPKRGYGGYLH